MWMRAGWLVMVAVAALAAAPAGPEAQSTADEKALHLPPISLRVTDATWVQIGPALAKATGAAITFEREPASDEILQRPLSYTLDLKDKAFWEVMLAVNAQHPIRMESGRGFAITAGEGIGGGVIVGNYYVYPYAILREQEANYQDPTGPKVMPETLRLFMRASADPRVCVVATKSVRLISAVDELGNELAAEDHRENPYKGGAGYHWGIDWSLKIPAKMGTKIVSLKGEQELSIGLGEKRTEVADVEKMSEPLNLVRQTLKVIMLENGFGGGKRFRIEMKAWNADKNEVEDLPLPLQLRLVTEQGDELWRGTYVPGPDYVSAIGGGTGYQYTGALKLVIIEPARFVKDTLRFELHNIPLPGGGGG